MPEITIEEILNKKVNNDEVVIENDDLKEIKEEFDNSDLFND